MASSTDIGATGNWPLCARNSDRALTLPGGGGSARIARCETLRHFVEALKGAGIRVSLFIEPDPVAIAASARLGADIVELHTGAYCERALEDDAAGLAREFDRLRTAATAAAQAGLEVHAGHGLTFNTVSAVARLPEIVELNIGHFLIGEAIFGGLTSAIQRMRALMDAARAEATSAHRAAPATP